MTQPHVATFMSNGITAALDRAPCGRCRKGHMLKNCPMGPDEGTKGPVWANFNNDIARATADAWLRAHPSYDPPAPPPPKEPSAKLKLPSRLGNAGGNPSNQHQPGPNLQVRCLRYENSDQESDMYYPGAEQLEGTQETTSSEGTPFPEKSMVKGAGKLRIPHPKYSLRQNFFATEKGDAILTNHFEYIVRDDVQFHEYRFLDLGTKNRKKLRILIENAIEHWAFLKEKQGVFATNYVDTIVAWEPLHLHDQLQDGDEDIEGELGAIEWGPFPIPDGKNSVAARFRFVKSLSTHGICRYASADPNYEHYNFDDISRWLNIVMSKSFNSDVHKVSANKFLVKKARVPLQDKHSISDSLEIIRGYFYNVKPGRGNIILNFNISTSAVYRPILVCDFLNGNNTFGDDQAAVVLNGKGVYVDLERQDSVAEKQKRLNSPECRYWKIFQIQRNGKIEDLKFRKKKTNAKGDLIKNNDGTFEMEQHDTRVVDHLGQVFGKMPVLGRPAVNVGSQLHPVWYAQEHLRIVPYQLYTRPVPDQYTSSMVLQASRTPVVSRAYIENEGLASLGFVPGTTQAPFNQRTDLPIRLNPTMFQVPHMVLPFPTPEYSTTQGGIIKVKAGSRWNFPPKHNAPTFLLTMPKQFNYAIIRSPGCHKTSPGYYHDEISRHISKCGLTTDQFGRIEIDDELQSTTDAAFTTKLKEAKVKGASLVVLVVDRYNLVTYRNFKTIADRIVGIQTICLVENFNTALKFKDDLMINVMMKLNLKLGGVNHGLQDVSRWLKNTMVLGGDLVHPGNGAFPGTPSIASIVGSVDDYGGKCLGSMRLQNVYKTDREVMDPNTVQAMVTERLEAWAKEHGGHSGMPDNILYYRDGVSTGHYSKVQTDEVNAIREAYAAVRQKNGLKPKRLNLTTVIVTKRHHTRFYPINAKDIDRWGNGNCKPGTCVDQLVCSPFYQDFYLQSHSGIKGTARPTHYFVLDAGIPKMTLENLRDLTHKLSYSYVRSMTPVSYVSPTYYADQLCERGRLYIRKYYNGDDDMIWNELWGRKKTLEDTLATTRAEKYGAEPHFKSKAEKDLEKEHAETVANDQKEHIVKKIRKDFYGDENELVGRNPWDATIADTMFWM